MGAVLSATKARRGSGEIVSAVEPIFELREITRNMLGTYGSIGSDQSRLDVAQRRVDPFEGGRFGGSRACAGLDRGVRASDVGDGRETRKTVGQDSGVGGERRSGELADRDKAERFDRPQDDLIGFSVVRCGDRRHERRLALGPSSAPTRTSAADVGVVHLQAPFNRLLALRSSMTCASLCFITQAVVWVTPSRRPSSMLEMPFLDCVKRKIALNQMRSGSLLEANMVPALTEVCLRQALHWNKRRAPRFTRQWPCPRQSGHSNPSGQRN